MLKQISLILCAVLFFGCGAKVKKIETAQLHFRAAQELFLKNENIQALAEAKKSEELNRKDPQVQNFLGILYAQIEEYDQAESHMRKAVGLESRYSEAQVNLCGFLMRKKQYEEAMKHCRLAAEDATYPNAERAYHNLGMMYEEQDNIDEGVKLYKKALLHNKNFVLSLQALGKIYYREKQFDQAEPVFQRADEACMSSPKGAWGMACPDTQYYFALTLFQLQKKREAITALKHCVETDPQGNLKKKCENRLRMFQ